MRSGGKEGRGASGNKSFEDLASTVANGSPLRLRMVPVRGYLWQERDHGAPIRLGRGSGVGVDVLGCWNALGEDGLCTRQQPDPIQARSEWRSPAGAAQYLATSSAQSPAPTAKTVGITRVGTAPVSPSGTTNTTGLEGVGTVLVQAEARTLPTPNCTLSAGSE